MKEVRFAELSDKVACEPFNALMSAPDNLNEKILRKDIIVAFDEQQVIGYLRLEKLWNNLPFISLVHVKESYRRRGVGKSLVRFVEKNVTTPIVLSSSKSNDAIAIAWHNAGGFQPCGDWKATHVDGCDELFFKKAIGEH